MLSLLSPFYYAVPPKNT